ncbi:MAG TPA: 30S ribosomal protein S17 [Rugosimonospora sp.]|jgi:small subunit ribosomal protein S17|nr:30S ribosomal protein S17 [Rugosimonospora sp.]
MATAVNNATEKRRRRNQLIGVVTSSKMQKTIVVRVTRQIRHRLYERYVHVNKKFYAHDEQGEARPGDVVRIVETRPMSKLKRWRLAEVLARRTSVD